ncbi:uncharacterized protein NPIL_178221 [Nephila pilipes]|uniref:Uncharacterized protein n=1 Tax=Nephila pilipes TaxID=299642 RepID=A0A8X6TA14_NEPPI|nr:uncharacterized protein NPIL_178221 [Nephila pilipes]
MKSAYVGYHHEMQTIGAHKKDILDYFSFKLYTAPTLIYGMKQSGSRIFSVISSDELIEDNEPPTKRRIPVFMPHESIRNQGVIHMPEIVGDRSHRSKYRMPKCTALYTVRCSSCTIFLCFNGSRNCFKRFHEIQRFIRT